MVVNFNKPLIPYVGIDGRAQVIKYDGLLVICYGCGCYGHSQATCSKGDASTVRVEKLEQNEKPNDDTKREKGLFSHGYRELEAHGMGGPLVGECNEKNENLIEGGRTGIFKWNIGTLEQCGQFVGY
ncbi:hypothetical protein Goshw_010206 [Gossypium schwendimanii]|uniref:CCHC-type domain-containing protein n=1 Tax=Gossypium schwendimanii TaxID=34291 RepID=A0A7J9L9V0_GOSSC|nr:hypothetical protein [Gossypium schwendimanii]